MAGKTGNSIDIKKSFLGKIKNPFQVSFLLTGIASTIWVLFRVIPKPSRLSYPCIKTAMPLMSGFLLYSAALIGSMTTFMKARTYFKNSRYLQAVLFFAASLIFCIFFVGSESEDSQAMTTFNRAEDPFISNVPIGNAQGIFPGRVIWSWDSSATVTSFAGGTYFFSPENNDQAVYNKMMRDAVLKMTGKHTLSSAWDTLFRSHNKKLRDLEKGYARGDKIFIKINMVTVGWTCSESDGWDFNTSDNKVNAGAVQTSPYVAYALLSQLIDSCGVDQQDISIGDPISHIIKHNYEYWHGVFPDVNYMDRETTNFGRTLLTPATTHVIHYSDETFSSIITDTLFQEMVDASYLINLSNLKAHMNAGVSLCAKNHFGSIIADGASHLHPALICPNKAEPTNAGYYKYRVLTDLMGHEKLGRNTILFVVDGYYGGDINEKLAPRKYNMPPFKGDWASSLFISQDEVALESVCYDFLRTEYNGTYQPETYPNWDGVDDYLHQAASSDCWPSGIVYDPEKDGTPIPSLGTHEHWNNMVDKQYSRNMGSGEGIELIRLPENTIAVTMEAVEATVKPVFDGIGDDNCWNETEWNSINQFWIPYGQSMLNTDFDGRFKLCWSSADNLLYVMAEITDDSFIDGYTCGDDGYYNFDILEIFLDADHSGETHLVDGTGTIWGSFPRSNGENAFSYHIAADIPDDGNTSTTYCVMDLGGTSTEDPMRKQYTSHIPSDKFMLRREGQKLTWEFAIKVYNDTYSDANPEASRKSLNHGDILGFCAAYCDADGTVGRDNFIGSDWGPDNGGEYNDHWWNADLYGGLRLAYAGENHAPEKTGEIPDLVLTALNDFEIALSNLNSIFSDPDEGQNLQFTVVSDDPDIVPKIVISALMVQGLDGFDGNAVITVTASDGTLSVSESFQVNYSYVGMVNTDISETLTCYPVPAIYNQLTLRVSNPLLTGTCSIRVLNMTGQVVKSMLYCKQFTTELIEIDFSGIDPGLYFIELVNRQYRGIVIAGK